MSTHDTSSAAPRSSDGASSEAPDGTSSEAAGVTALATLSDDAARSGAGSGTALPGDVVRSDGAAPPGAAAADSRTRPSALRNPWALGLIGIILPVLLVLVWLTQRRRGPLAGQYNPSDGWVWRWFWALPVTAFVYTTPWDNFLVFREVWSYPPDRVLGRVGYVPYEEYAFFVLQTLISGLLLLLLMRRTGATPAVCARPALARAAASLPP